MLIETSKNENTGKYEVDIKTNGVVAELEANKEVSIDVSNYSEPVEITPSSGKDGMEKTTITLTNISSGGGGVTVEPLSVTANGTYTAPAGKAYSPVTVNVPSSGGSATLYAWKQGGEMFLYLNIDTAPENPADAQNIKYLLVESETRQISIDKFLQGTMTYEYIADNEFNILENGQVIATFSRKSANDVTLWG